VEKLDLIIAALQRVELLFEAHGQYPHTLREVNEALTAAKELRALKPVAWVGRRMTSEGRALDGFETCDSDEYEAIPVYILDEVIT
tara:strand:+ start:1173 stop:1430 length:258 start_codon:yes stop_codon:yes gene_type:complete